MQYQVTYFVDSQTIPQQKLLSYVKEPLANAQKVLKDDRRSLVFVVEYNGLLYVVKNPRDKNRRLWIRFLTLFRPSEAMMALESMQTLLNLKIPTTKPIACIEKRFLGIVLEGWMVYEYFEAEPISTKEIKSSLALLESIHSFGFLHGNPQELNFLHFDKKIATIDAKLTKVNQESVETWIEKIKFANSFINPSDREAVRALLDQKNPNFKKAKQKLHLRRLCKSPKHWFKGLLQGRLNK